MLVMNMNSMKSADPLFNMTSCPDLNTFIDRVKSFYSMEISEDEFRMAVDDLDDFRRRIRAVMEDQLRSNVLSPLKKRSVEVIKARLESLRSAVSEIRRYFDDSNREHIDSGLGRCRRYIEEMSAAASAMIEEEKSENAKYSRAPLQNELMRIAYDVMAGRLPKGILSEKLTALKRSLKDFYSSIGDFPEEEQGGHYLMMHRDEIKTVLKSYFKALDECEAYFSSGSKSALESSLKKAAASAELLVDHQEKMMNEKRVKICVKCGGENEMSAKFCVKCNAVLPEVVS